MENLMSLEKQKFFNGLILTRENLCIASTLTVPLILLVFLPVESLLIITMLALFFLTITAFHIKKDRDSWMHSCEVCRDLLEAETKKLELEKKKENKILVNFNKSVGTPENILSM